MSAQNNRPSLKRRVRSAVYGPIARGRDALYKASPPWAVRNLWPLVDYLDMFFIDHGIFRLFYANRYKISDRAWRSAQPWPHQVRYYAKKKGIKTIVNLRGVRDCGSYRLEKAACEKYGVKLVSYKMHSGAPPDPAVITGFKEFFDGLEHPILIHCKSGADRAGIAATLYKYLNEERSFDEAVDQLHFRYGHFKFAKTGILDHFFETYRRHNETAPTPFLRWVETEYEPEKIRQGFKTNFWSNFFVERVLRRE